MSDDLEEFDKGVQQAQRENERKRGGPIAIEVRYGWNQPICERDWIDQMGTWEKNADGDLGDRLVSLRMPVRVRLDEPIVERCSWCGGATIFGAYKRADPASVPYPALKED